MHRAPQPNGQMPPRYIARNKHDNDIIQISVQANYCAVSKEPLSKGHDDGSSLVPYQVQRCRRHCTATRWTDSPGN